MPRFVKRPIIVEAEQWFPGKDVSGVFVEDPYRCEGEIDEPEPPPGLSIRHFVVTIHRQRAYLSPGDWVISECDGVHHYPCKPDEFARIYKAVQDEADQAVTLASNAPGGRR